MATVYTQVGEEHTADLFDGTASAPASYYIGWGTGTGATKASTGLVTPASEARVAAAASQPLADKNQFVATLTAGASKTISEAALFTASAAGVCVVHGDFAGIALSASDQIEFTITLEWT